MADLHSTNRAMFWRIIRRLLGANRGRLFVILLALGAGAAVTAALLNLQVDAKRRLTTEFRAFGPNVLITPRAKNTRESVSALLSEAVVPLIASAKLAGSVQGGAAILYGIAEVLPNKPGKAAEPNSAGVHVVVAGYSDDTLDVLAPYVRVEQGPPVDFRETPGHSPWASECISGKTVASQLSIHASDLLVLRNGETGLDCVVREVRSFGSSEDSQILTSLQSAQKLFALPGAISIAQLRISGTPAQITESIQSIQQRLNSAESQITHFTDAERGFNARSARITDQAVEAIQQRLSGAEVRPIRQFTEGEAKIYNRISGLLTFTVVLVLVLTGLCVMAAMTNVAMERKMDVGLMKAIGGATRRVLRLFLAEAALLGLAGGIIGAAAGIFISIGLGKAVFGVAARPRLIVYPVAVALTVIVAIISAYPLRRLASIRPASVFRGEA